jgi:hypothetical protein
VSSIASFFIIAPEQIPALKQLAQQPVGPSPQRSWAIGYRRGAWRDPFWQFLYEKARELERYNWSGEVMIVIEKYLQSVNVDLHKYGDRELSDYLSAARGDD